jgi:hypothetical protein
MPQIHFDDSLPTQEPIRIFNPPDGVHVIVLLGSWRALWLHWRKGGSDPCLGPDCPKARCRRHTYQRAYATSMLEKISTTPGSGRVFEAKLIGFNPFVMHELIGKPNGLRGRCVELEVREKGRKQSVLQTYMIGKENPLLPDFAIEPVLYRVFRMRPTEKPVESKLESPAEPSPVILPPIGRPVEDENGESFSNRNQQFAARYRELEKKNGQPRS